MAQKSHCSMGYSIWYVKIDSSQNQDLSTSLERPYKELLNTKIILENRHSELKLRAIKELAKIPLQDGLTTLGAIE